MRKKIKIGSHSPISTLQFVSKSTLTWHIAGLRTVGLRFVLLKEVIQSFASHSTLSSCPVVARKQHNLHYTKQPMPNIVSTIMQIHYIRFKAQEYMSDTNCTCHHAALAVKS